MKQVYQAFDGSIFDAEQDCIDHEIALRSKGEMVIDWLISAVDTEVSGIDVTDPEEAESHVESSETLRWLHQIKNRSRTERLIELGDEAEHLAYRWEDKPRSLEAARLMLELSESLDVASLPFLRRAIRILNKAHACTRVVMGRPIFPSVDEDTHWGKFSDAIYFLDNMDLKSVDDNSCVSANQSSGWINTVDNGEYCKSCRYWSMDDPATGGNLHLAFGICKRNPPVDGDHPSTNPWDSCGEWDG
jgi:hypothetical protein